MMQLPGANLNFIEKHVPLSMSICAYIVPYEEVICFVRTSDEDMHVQSMCYCDEYVNMYE